MRTYYGWCAILALILAQTTNAQEDEIADSIGLNEVVVTGQFSAQSIDKSIYQVEVISQEDIKNQAGNTVADILSQTLNILIVPDSSTGDSQVSIMGLDGGYTKILVDNIPLIGDNGLGTFVDLTKINLDNVEQIEIVKGAMGVDYGNNALAGVINIITKKGMKNTWKINATVQEESVGDEYDWYEDGGVSKGKGRHIQAIEVSHNISDKWFVSLGGNRNDFQGYWGEKMGAKYINVDATNDKLRGYDWLPKEQVNGNGLLSFRDKNFQAFYKVNFLNEDINFFDDSYKLENLGEGQTTYNSKNIDYKTERWLHQLNISTKIFNLIKYNGDFSYQSQDRKYRQYYYDVPNRTDAEEKPDYSTFASSKAFYSRGTFSDFIKSDWINFQVGYELDNTKGFRKFDPDINSFDEDINKRIETYAGFASVEIYTNAGISLRPGFRASFSSKFDNQYNFSLSSKYDLSRLSSLRFVAGTANRYPNFDELYTYFVDSNHDVRGNENLLPEDGYSTAIQWNIKTINDKFKMTNNVSTIYMDVDDRIELSIINSSPLQYQYINIDKYKAWGVSTANNFLFYNFDINLGASILGISKRLTSGEAEPIDEYRYTFEANAAVNYTLPKLATTLSLYYKYTGKSSEYIQQGGLTEEAYYVLGERNDFSMLNFSIRKGLFKNSLEITLGARNLLDVTSVRNTYQTGDFHTAAPSDQMLFYGRSYFIKLNYSLNFK